MILWTFQKVFNLFRNQDFSVKSGSPVEAVWIAVEPPRDLIRYGLKSALNRGPLNKTVHQSRGKRSLFYFLLGPRCLESVYKTISQNTRPFRGYPPYSFPSGSGEASTLRSRGLWDSSGGPRGFWRVPAKAIPPRPARTPLLGFSEKLRARFLFSPRPARHFST